MNNQFNCLKQYKGEEVLILLAYLQTMPENSSFLYRIMDCQAQVLIQLQQYGILWKELAETLENGDVMEDNMFVQQVNTPQGSFSVFPGIYAFYQWNLSRLLRVARIEQVPNELLSIVYFLLEVSQIIADRSNLRRYEIGEAKDVGVLMPQQRITEKEAKRICFSETEMHQLLSKYGLDMAEIDGLVFSASWKELEDEIGTTGHANLIDLRPFYKLSSEKFLVLRPSALLHLAYKTAVEYIIDSIGSKLLLDSYNKLVGGEVANVILHYGHNIIGHGVVADIPYYVVRFDRNKVAIVLVPIADRNPDLIEANLVIKNAVTEKGMRDELITIVVYSSIDELWCSMQIPENSIVFTIDEFVFVLSQPDMTFNLLYYYGEDKIKYRIDAFTQDIDGIMYYLSHKQTFYLEQQPTSFYIGLGAAYPIYSHFYLTNDIRNVYIPYLDAVASIHHYKNVPSGIPIYEPYLASEKFRFLMVDLEPYHLFLRPSYRMEGEYGLFLEIGHSILLWLHVIRLKTGIEPLSNDIDIEMDITEKENAIKELSFHSYLISIGNKYSDDKEVDVEKLIFSTFVQLLQSKNELNSLVSNQVIDSVFNESKGHFMVVGDYSSLRANDGINKCYFVSERWSDVVLDNIADYLDMKGVAKRLSIEESKETIIKALEYLNNEVSLVLHKFDTIVFLHRIVELHHAMIYWSSLTDYRYKQIDNAYHYIGTSFEKQDDYSNKYSEMKIITQGIVEYIVINDIHAKHDTSTFCDCERLFALMRHILSFGLYLDMLNEVGEGMELSILANGRLLFYDGIPAVNNEYLYTLRSRMMNYPDILKRQHELLPPYEVDLKCTEFTSSFVSEYGISPKKYFSIQEKSIAFAEQHRRPVVVMEKSQFESLILDSELSESEKACFYNSFVLSKSLNNEGTKPSDFYIQRFNRISQLTTRPWIEYDNQVAFSTKAIIESFQVFINRIFEGVLHSKSDKMKSYMSSINKQKGHWFVKNLQKYYQSLPNDLNVNMEVEIGPNCQLKADEYLGDIDLLIIDKGRKEIVCVEAKDYAEAKTVYEMSLRNKKMNKDIFKVENRHNWCKNHIESFVRLFKLGGDAYSLSTIMLTYYEPVYYYFPKNRHADIPIISAFEIIRDPYCVFNKHC